MAQSVDSEYFPALQRCLDRELGLRTWKDVYQIFHSPLLQQPNISVLESFLSDKRVVDILSRPFDIYLLPSAQSKSAFETKTSAINVAPSPNGSYDLEQIKDDALWLAAEAGIDEMSSLYITVLEWQVRANSELIDNLSAGESTSLQGLVGDTFEKNVFAIKPAGFGTSLGRPEPGTDNSRRLRLLKVLLAERRYALKVGECLEYFWYLENFKPIEDIKGKGRESMVDSMLENIQDTRNSRANQTVRTVAFPLECILALNSRLENLDKGCSWLSNKPGMHDIREIWERNQLLEMIHILRMLFCSIDQENSVTPSPLMVSWMTFVFKSSFFDSFNTPVPDHQNLAYQLQSLIAVISLTMLKLPMVLELLLLPPEQLGENNTPNDPYITNLDAVTKVNICLTTAALSKYQTAAPAVFAWSIILQLIREISTASKEHSELLQFQQAAQTFISARSPENSAGDSDQSRQNNASSRNGVVEPNILDNIIEKIMDNELGEDPIGFLASSAVKESRVFDIINDLSTGFCRTFISDFAGTLGLRIRTRLLELICASTQSLNYLPEVIVATVATLSGGEQYWDFAGRSPFPRQLNPTIHFLKEDELQHKILDVAYYRFPHESLPLLRLIKALATSYISEEDGVTVVELLVELNYFTTALPASFDGYNTTREEENFNMVSLTRELEIFSDKNQFRLRGGSTNSLANSLVQESEIPSETIGRIISESAPTVVLWHYNYCGLTYLGRVLETYSPNSELINNLGSMDSDQEIAIEIIGLLTALLTPASGPNNEVTNRVLEMASDGLGRNGDIIATVFNIFENALQKHQSVASSQQSMDLLINCMQFIHALIPTKSNRVWPLLHRCRLLDIDAQGGRLVSIITGTEIVSGRFEFLVACVRVFNSLIESAVSTIVQRKANESFTPRFDQSIDTGNSVPDRVISTVLLAFERVLVDVLESFSNWSFEVLEERLEIGSRILATFNKILYYTYSVGDEIDLTKKLTSVLASAAQFLTETYLSSSAHETSARSVLYIMAQGIYTPNSTIFLRPLELWVTQVVNGINFCNSLLKVARLKNLDTCFLQTQLFKASPLLVRLYAVQPAYQLPILLLLRSLISSSAGSQEEPPSLLGYLGPETSKNFLRSLSNLQFSTSNEKLEIGIWNLLSAIVSNRQQWFSIFLLTGSAPRGALKENKGCSDSPKDKSFLTVALDFLSNLGSSRSKKSLAMMEFVVLAQDYWPWAVSGIQSHPEFLGKCSEYILALPSQPDVNGSAKTISCSIETRIASFIAEIFAMSIHNKRQLGDNSYAKNFLGTLAFFVARGVTVSGYNPSLQANLGVNFKSVFPGCDKTDFKRTSFESHSYGETYVYSIKMAEKILKCNRGWYGRQNNGLKNDFILANINLSFVESQICLLHSWKFLAFELINSLPKDPLVQRAMAQVIKDCLVSNTQNTLPELIFETIRETRSDFATIILQKLLETNSIESSLKNLLNVAWQAISSSKTSFEIALLSGDPSHYRHLLRVLFLCLKARKLPCNGAPVAADSAAAPQSSKIVSKREDSHMILEILNVVVIKGFRDLASSVHIADTHSSPEDLAIISAILRATIHSPELERHGREIANLFSVDNTSRIATTLFSWSEQLAVDGDPIYGELSILFLLELSTIPAMAEQLALDDILTQISTAGIMKYLHKGITPFSEGGMGRIYNIWAGGLLPLILNLLSVGPAIAMQATTFLNQYSKQLSLVGFPFGGLNSYNTSEAITLTAAAEAHSLALITLITASYRNSGIGSAAEIPALMWKPAVVLNDVEVWLSTRGQLRANIVPTSAKEARWAREPPLNRASGCKHKLEEKIIIEFNAVVALLSGYSP